MLNEIGQLVNFHGVKGEVKIISNSDFLHTRFEIGNTVVINDTSYVIDSYRTHKTFHLLKFKGVTNINQVEHLKGELVYQEFDDVPLELGPHEYHYSDIIGLSVYDLNEQLIGTVERIFKTGANDVWVVKGDKEYLIPYIEDVVKEVSLEDEKIYIDPIEGLLE